MKTNQLLFSKVKKGFYAVLMLTVMATTIVGCKKDEDDDDNQTTPTASTIPPISDGDGFLIAVNTITTTTNPYTGTLEIPLGTGVAVFPTTTGGSTYADAGAITLEGEALTKQTNNSYIYTPSASDPYGLDLENASTIDWTVAGAGSVPAITHTVNRAFPELGVITSDTSDNLSTTQDFTLSVASVTNSDSVLFQLSGQDDYITVIRPAGTTSYTFSAADVASVGKGYAVIQVVGYNFESNMEGGKKIYYINESVRSIVVTID